MALRGERSAIRAPRVRRQRRWWIVAGVVVMLALVFFARPRTLEVATVSAVALPANAGPAAVLDASGFVVARRQATVSAKVTGKVMEVLIEEGMRVKAGQILARLDASQSGLQHTLANRQVDAALCAYDWPMPSAP
jgi:multidrug efflux pump subunit AcrA (membrane-fusion protein)